MQFVGKCLYLPNICIVMKKEVLIEQFKANNGWLHSKDFDYQNQVYEKLYEMIENHEVEKVQDGLFKYLPSHSYSAQEELAQIYPKGVFCLFSAWQYYGLSTTVSFQQHMAFPHKSNLKKIAYPPVQLYYWSEGQYLLGINDIDHIKFYDIEKSVCDAVKFRNKVGEEIMYEVLKNYMNLKTRNLEKLMSYAQMMRLEKIMTPILKSLL